MRKIYTGIAALAMTMVVVAGTAYALFTSTVTVTGAVLGTATTGLTLQAYFSGAEDFTDPSTVLDLGGNSFVDPLYPGQSDWGHIKLNNESEPPVDMQLTAQLTAFNASSDWDQLKGVLQMRVREWVGDPTVDGYDNVTGNDTAWMTLEQWNSAPRTLPGGTLPGDGERQYLVEVRLPANAGDEYKGLEVDGLQFEINGTQVTP